MVLSLLQLAPQRVLRMKELAAGTNATLPRLSHVVSRLEERGLVERFPCPEDKRATNARLTDAGRRAIIRATPGHVETVRGLVLDQLSRQDIDALATVAGKIARNLDPTDRLGRLLGSGGPAERSSAQAS
jgi:DNA-binding MarR family transcriptional regulator